MIGVAGMDGSGKSTLVDRFCKAVQTSEFTDPVLVHLLPDSIPSPHKIVRRQTTITNYTRPYSQPPVRSRINASLRLIYYLLVFAAARAWCAGKAARGRMLVFDRSAVDFFSDLSRSRIPHVRVPGWLLRALMPRGAFFYLDAAPETVVARKGELTINRAEELSARYRSATQAAGVGRLDGERDANAVFSEFLRAVSESVLRRMRPRGPA